MSDIRFLGRNELAEAARLADLVFRDVDQSSMAEAFPPIFSGNYGSSIGVYEEGKLVSFIGLVPSFLQVGGVQLPIFSIGSVCTHPDYRGQGYAGELLERVFRFIEASEGSLLLISGDRSLYLRNGCHPFGQVRRYMLSASAAPARPQVSPESFCTVREALESDRLRIHTLYERASVRYQRSLFETAELIRAEALAGIYKLKHKLVVAEAKGAITAYALVAVPGSIQTEAAPFVVEWGGEAGAAVEIFSYAIQAYALTGLQVTVPWQEKELQSSMAARLLDYSETRNSGTIKLVNPRRFWEQITPYLADRDKEAFERLELRHAEAEYAAAEFSIDGKTLQLSSEKLISLLFDVEPAIADDADESQLALIRKLFPIPLPYASGLNFI